MLETPGTGLRLARHRRAFIRACHSGRNRGATHGRAGLPQNRDAEEIFGRQVFEL